MKKSLPIVLVVIACLCSMMGKSQVGLNNPNPDPSSILDLKSTDRGVLIPRMSTGERNAMAIGTPTPAEGLLVFDTTLDRIYFWDGTKWRAANTVVADSTGVNEVLRIKTRMSVGSGYTGSEPASNGLVVEGNTGIGTDSPGSDKLSVNGSTKLNGNTVINGSVDITGATSITGNTTVTGNITTTGTVSAAGYGLAGASANGPVPTGGIIMWSGAVNAIPTGWALCDGTNGTPNLEDRFVLGSGTTYAHNSSGGSATHGHTTNTAGDHNHALSSTSNGGNTGGITNYDPTVGAFHSTGYYAEDDHQGWHANSYLETGYNSGYGEGNHAHLLHGNTGNGGNHSHTVSTTNHLPPYYALAFIIKL
ncbi:MAG: hypothetical protein ACPGEG_01730 [Salibacteraceae bacterium]